MANESQTPPRVPIWQVEVNSLVLSGAYGWLLVKEQVESGTVVVKRDLTICTVPGDNLVTLEYNPYQLALAGFSAIFNPGVN